MELNREQIIKALECFSGNLVKCRECGYLAKHNFPQCKEFAAMDALSLIKELTEENEKLSSLCTSKDIIIADQNKDYIALDMEFRTVNTELHATRTELARVQEENERLRGENEIYAELEQGCYVTGVKKVQADRGRCRRGWI